MLAKKLCYAFLQQKVVEGEIFEHRKKKFSFAKFEVKKKIIKATFLALGYFI